MKKAVLTFVIHNDQILLAESNYRPGRTTWNGISGFVEDKEKPEEAAVRELYEEVKLRVYTHDLEQVGVMHLSTVNPEEVREETLTITIFLCENFQGQARMTPGVRPRWFDFTAIPYQDMFEDTKDWLERILTGEKLIIDIISKADDQTESLQVKDVLIRNVFEK